MKSASFQSLTQRGMSRYVMKMAGIRRKIRIRKPRMNNLPIVIPVTSGIWNSLQGKIVPMYMKPPKFRSTSRQLLTSSCRLSASSKYSPFQFRAFPATKQARRSSVPIAPHIPIMKSCQCKVSHLVLKCSRYGHHLHLLLLAKAGGFLNRSTFASSRTLWRTYCHTR
jgi:hypothetical protein